MLELGRELASTHRCVFWTFREEERCWDFVAHAGRLGFEAAALKNDAPKVLRTYHELKELIGSVNPSVLICHGYKANAFGLLAARRLGIPVISVSHGWTGESRRVRLFEALDRFLLRWMDKVVCVSEGQARKVRCAGVRAAGVQVICDAVRVERFVHAESCDREYLERLFPERPRLIVGAAGRLSPEKGFGHLVEAAVHVLREHSDVGFVLFGDGPLRAELTRQVEAAGLTRRFHLAGFRSDVDRYYPHLDLLVLPSYTEGLPNVVLEAFAAGVPVVATAVGGTPEVVKNGVNGYLVEPRDVGTLARRIGDIIADDVRRREMGCRAHRMVRDQFSFASQGKNYRRLLESLIAPAGTTERPKASSRGTTLSRL